MKQYYRKYYKSGIFQICTYMYMLTMFLFTNVLCQMCVQSLRHKMLHEYLQTLYVNKLQMTMYDDKWINDCTTLYKTSFTLKIVQILYNYKTVSFNKMYKYYMACPSRYVPYPNLYINFIKSHHLRPSQKYIQQQVLHVQSQPEVPQVYFLCQN